VAQPDTQHTHLTQRVSQGEAHLGTQNPYMPARATTKFALCELMPLQVSWAGWLQSSREVVSWLL
jgi:hypothetical protein